MAMRSNRVAWGLAAVLAVLVLGGSGLLGMRLRWIWVARNHGERAMLDGAVMPGVILKRANLKWASLKRANLKERGFVTRSAVVH